MAREKEKITKAIITHSFVFVKSEQDLLAPIFCGKISLSAYYKMLYTNHLNHGEEIGVKNLRL